VLQQSAKPEQRKVKTKPFITLIILPIWAEAMEGSLSQTIYKLTSVNLPWREEEIAAFYVKSEISLFFLKADQHPA
jgi:hypothetical protein